MITSFNSLNETGVRNTYATPTCELYYFQNEETILAGSGDDDDNTGGTGHNMPWDD